MAGKVTPLTSKTPDKPNLDRVTSVESVFTVGANNWWRMNPDDLVRQKGVKVYSKMRLDDQVKAASTFKRDAIVSRGWTFSYDDSSKLNPDEQKRRINMFEEIIEEYPGSFVDAINGVACGREYGFSLVEKVFSDVDLSTGAAIGISALLYRDPSMFEFVTDEFGSLVEFRQRAGGKLIQLNLKDFVHYVHAPEADRYYGQSDLRAAYKYWFAKQNIQNYWLLFLERLAGGFPVLTAKDSSAPRPGTSDYGAMRDMLVGLRSAAGLLVPQGMEFKLEQMSSTEDFQKAITFFDLGIARSMLVPNLLGASHTGQTGAYSQSQTQLEAFYWTLQQDQARLEATLNEQLFQPLARYNFDDGDGPCFSFKPLSEERMRWLVTTWAALISGNAVVATEEDEAFLRKLMDMPERDETATELQTPQQKMQAEALKAQADQQKTQIGADQQARKESASQQKQLNAIEEQLSQITVLLAAKPATVNVTLPSAADTSAHRATLPTEDVQRMAGVHVHDDETVIEVDGKFVHGKPRFTSLAVYSAAVQRVAFAVIEQKQMQATDSVVRDLAASVADAVSRVCSDAKLEKALASPEKISTIKFSGSEIGGVKQAMKGGLVNSYIDGVSLARNELERAGLRMQMKRATFASIKNVAADYLDANGFRIAGNVSDASRAIIQQELLNGVKSGSTTSDVRTSIWNRLVSKGMTTKEAVLGIETDEGILAALDELWVDTESQAAAYLNTIVRTNLFDAFNEGRFAEFTDPALDGFVEAFEYSAILDDRTTEICQTLNGSTWNADNPLWDTFKPPNHYNCRSLLIPVTKVDSARGEWDGDEDPPPPDDIQPQEGFGPGEKG